MTRTERNLLLGFGLLGLLVLITSATAAGILMLAGTSFQLLVPSSDGAGVHVPAAVSQVIEAAGSRGEEVEERAARSLTAAVPRIELPLRAPQLGAGPDLTQVYEQVTPGVVSIEVRQSVQSPFGGGEFFQEGSGSGFVYDEGYIVTNNHVVSGADAVEIVFFDGQRRDGTVAARDRFTDLAVVRVDDMPDTARALPVLRHFEELEVGQPVVAIGNPFGNANTMTFGIVSALGRVIPSGLANWSIPQTIQTDAAINPGNSGGPLLDLQGRVIGVNAQIRTANIALNSPPGNSGVGFAIPSSVVARVVPALIEDGEYEWSYLGVTGMSDITLEVARANNLADTRGAYITEVLPDGPSAGLLEGASNISPRSAVPDEEGSMIIPLVPGQTKTPVGGDVVIAVDGQPVGSFDDLLTYVALETVPGQTVELVVLRDGQKATVPVQLGARPTR